MLVTHPHLVTLMPAKHFFRLFVFCILVLSSFLFTSATFAETTNNDLGADLVRGAFSGDLLEVKRLLENGANVNAKREDGLTALMGASLEGHQEIVELLLTKNPEVDAKVYFYGHTSGATACDLASQKGYKDIVKLLVRAGAFHEEKAEEVFHEKKVSSPESTSGSRRRRD